MNNEGSDSAGPFFGLTIGRIVHVVIKLPIGAETIVERPAIVTGVQDKGSGVISAQVFKDPSDPPGEVFATEPGKIARPLGTKIRYHGDTEHLRPWTWHWPERVS